MSLSEASHLFAPSDCSTFVDLTLTSLTVVFAAWLVALLAAVADKTLLVLQRVGVGSWVGSWD